MGGRAGDWGRAAAAALAPAGAGGTSRNLSPPPSNTHPKRARAGKLKARLERHTGPVFALRWNKRGDLLLTSSADESTVVWDVAAGAVKQQFAFQGGAPRRARGAGASRVRTPPRRL